MVREHRRSRLFPYTTLFRSVIEGGGYRFTVKVGKPNDAEAAKNGTKLARANFLCLMSGSPIAGDYIKTEGKAGRIGARRSEEHTSELQSLRHLVCRLLLEKK